MIIARVVFVVLALVLSGLAVLLFIHKLPAQMKFFGVLIAVMALIVWWIVLTM